MTTQTQVTLGLGIILALVIGFFIGKGVGQNQALTQSGFHKMPDGRVMMNHGDMSTMMHDMNASLEGKTGDVFDKEFLVQMIVHHEGAVAMAQKVLEVSKRPELIKLANNIISAQTGEIKMMNDWKVGWFK
jgi:uncharacterized protein (DUF305 family)